MCGTETPTCGEGAVNTLEIFKTWYMPIGFKCIPVKTDDERTPGYWVRCEIPSDKMKSVMIRWFRERYLSYKEGIIPLDEVPEPGFSVMGPLGYPLVHRVKIKLSGSFREFYGIWFQDREGLFRIVEIPDIDKNTDRADRFIVYLVDPSKVDIVPHKGYQVVVEEEGLILDGTMIMTSCQLIKEIADFDVFGASVDDIPIRIGGYHVSSATLLTDDSHGLLDLHVINRLPELKGKLAFQRYIDFSKITTCNSPDGLHDDELRTLQCLRMGGIVNSLEAPEILSYQNGGKTNSGTRLASLIVHTNPPMRIPFSTDTVLTSRVKLFLESLKAFAHEHKDFKMTILAEVPLEDQHENEIKAIWEEAIEELEKLKQEYPDKVALIQTSNAPEHFSTALGQFSREMYGPKVQAML